MTYANSIQDINDTAIKLNVSLNKTIWEISDLEHSLHELNNTLNHVSDALKHVDLFEIRYRRKPGILFNEEGFAEMETDESISIKKAADIYEYIEGIGKLVNSGVELYGSFEKLPSTLDHINNDVKLFNSGVEVFSKMDTLVQSSNLKDSLTMLSEMFTAAELIAGLAPRFGPYGMAISAGIFAAGGVINYLSSDVSGVSQKASFADQGLKNKNPYLTDVYHANLRLNGIMDRAKSAEPKNDKDISNEVQILKEKFLSKGGNIMFDSDRAESGDPVYLKALVAALNDNDRSKHHPITKVIFDDKNDMNAFRTHFDAFSRFPLDKLPEVPSKGGSFQGSNSLGIGQYSPYIPAMSQKEYRRQNSKARKSNPYQHFSDAILKNAIRSYEIHGIGYVQAEYNDLIKKFGNVPGFTKNADQMWKSFQKARREVDATKISKAHASEISNNRGGKNANEKHSHISINLNKSLIEHFTINVKDTKEGLIEFKHKVENVLLEILNSANVIQ